jgi:P4 family phage/plasmid primase-like protien
MADDDRSAGAAQATQATQATQAAPAHVHVPTSAAHRALSQFLSARRVDKGHDHTHTSMGRPPGSFYVSVADGERLLQLYRAALQAGDDLHLTEHHRHIGPLLVDLDFRFEPTAEDLVAMAAGNAAGGGGGGGGDEGAGAGLGLRRRHGPLVERIVRAYCEAVADIIELPSDGAIDVYVTEKPAPTALKGLVKDGLHLMMPGVVTRPEVQMMVRRAVLPAMAELLGPLQLANRVEDVVDEAVIERNNWMMFGSRKPGCEPYRVTARYSYDRAGRLLRVALPAEEPCYVELLSIRNKYDESVVREDRRERVDAYVAKQDDDRRRRATLNGMLTEPGQVDARQNTCVDLDVVRQLAGVLDASRVESYNDWMRLGWCLRNIDHRLLESWDEVSKRSSKYVEGECARLWHTMRAGGLGIGTLHMWAKHDAPERYREILRVDLARLIRNSLSATHYDVACVVHHLYRYEFACSNIRNRTWYEFRDHRWRECDSAYALRRRLSNDVFREYVAAKQLTTARATATDDEAEQKELLQQSKKLADLALKLKVTAFKDNVLKECCELFYREYFEDLLDSDINLLGFENGVYDLSAHEFREGRPDDHVSFSTGINHVPFVADHACVRAVMRFWESVHPSEEIREYVLLTLASCLSGQIREERFHIWTGSGSNGKSLSVSLFEKTLGQYCCKFPVTLLTQKRTASSSATPEIARAKGRRFAVLQEPSEDERLNVGQLKELSGGDTVQTRELFKAPCEWRPQFKLFLLCNQLPHVPSDDGGTWRRIRVVEFGSKFVDNPNPERPNEFPIDLELTGKLDGWKEHFMAILLQYHKRYVTTRLCEPHAVLQCTHEYQRTNDHMADFVDCCVEKVAEQPQPQPHDDGGAAAGAGAGAGAAAASQPCMTIDEAMAEIKQWICADNVPIKAPKKQVLQRYLDRVLGKGAPGPKGARQHSYAGWRIRDRFGGGDGAEDDL